MIILIFKKHLRDLKSYCLGSNQITDCKPFSNDRGGLKFQGEKPTQKYFS